MFLQAVRYLAECRANREKMKSELGMMLSLQNVMQKQVSVTSTSHALYRPFTVSLYVHFSCVLHKLTNQSQNECD